jgi:hypothetical protein
MGVVHVERWRVRGDHLVQRSPPGEEPLAQLRERQVRLTRDHVIRQPGDFLLVGFVAHLRPADDDDHVRPDPLELRGELRRRRDVPDVDADADDPRVPRQDGLQRIHRPLRHVELEDARAVGQRSEVGQQVAQPERGVRVFRVERGQDDVGGHDVGHGWTSVPAGRHAATPRERSAGIGVARHPESL